MNPLEMATDLASKPDNDWQSLMFNPALMQNYNLSVKGGGKFLPIIIVWAIRTRTV